MEDATLLFRHLPSELSQEERKDFLHHIGGNQIRLMGSTGPMKNTAFVVFQSPEKAKEVLSQLHQTEFLGSTLVVEFARKPLDSPNLPSIVDKEGVKFETEEDDVENKEASDAAERKKRRANEMKFDSAFSAWGLHHPRRPELRYLYPPPNPSILTNIMHAIASVPKFYVQVLHLMNKMDLPAPFGMVTPKPPVNPEVQLPAVPDDVSQKEMDISSSSESELSSSDEEKKRLRDEQKLHRSSLKHKLSRKKLRKSDMKRPKLSDLQDVENLTPSSNVPSVSISDVFEKSNDTGPMKKIEMKISGVVKSSVNFNDDSEHFHSHLYNPCEPTIPLPPPPMSGFEHNDNFQSMPQTFDPAQDYKNSEILCDANQEEESVAAVGFGVIEPQPKEVEQDEEEEDTEKTWSKTRFVSSSELRKNRLSSREMKELSVFKRYSSGDPSCRLYIKNLSKQVSEEDLHWVFGKYVDWESETETNIFDIRLMKEGRMKGQSFITLPNEEAAKSAVKDTNGFVFKDKPMVVQFARSAKAEEDKASKI